jgi:hypothetical protein
MRPAAFVRKWAGTHEPEAIQPEGDVGKAGADVDRRERVRSDPEHVNRHVIGTLDRHAKRTPSQK